MTFKGGANTDASSLQTIGEILNTIMKTRFYRMFIIFYIWKISHASQYVKSSPIISNNKKHNRQLQSNFLLDVTFQLLPYEMSLFTHR